jgi:hypothetical protein
MCDRCGGEAVPENDGKVKVAVGIVLKGHCRL